MKAMCRASFMDMGLVQSHRNLLAEGTCAWFNVLLSIGLTFLVIFEQGVLCFPFALSSANYVASPGYRGGPETSREKLAE